MVVSFNLNLGLNHQSGGRRLGISRGRSVSASGVAAVSGGGERRRSVRRDSSGREKEH